MKDYLILSCFVASNVALITADQVSDFQKCVLFLLFLVCAACWLLFTKQGHKLRHTLDEDDL